MRFASPPVPTWDVLLAVHLSTILSILYAYLWPAALQHSTQTRQKGMCILTPNLSLLTHSLQNNAHVPKLVEIMVKVLGHGTRLVAGEVGKRMAALLHQLQGAAPAAVQAAAGSLSAKQQANFQTYMSGNIPNASDD